MMAMMHTPKIQTIISLFGRNYLQFLFDEQYYYRRGDPIPMKIIDNP
jgi:hypothetical protein